MYLRCPSYNKASVIKYSKDPRETNQVIMGIKNLRSTKPWRF